MRWDWLSVLQRGVRDLNTNISAFPSEIFEKYAGVKDASRFRRVFSGGASGSAADDRQLQRAQRRDAGNLYRR